MCLDLQATHSISRSAVTLTHTNLGSYMKPSNALTRSSCSHDSQILKLCTKISLIILANSLDVWSLSDQLVDSRAAQRHLTSVSSLGFQDILDSGALRPIHVRTHAPVPGTLAGLDRVQWQQKNVIVAKLDIESQNINSLALAI